MSKKVACCLKAKQDPNFPKSLLKKCCCSCQYLFKLYGHPWVNGKTMSDVCGYACGFFMITDNEKGLVLNSGHGICECHESKTKNKE